MADAKVNKQTMVHNRCCIRPILRASPGTEFARFCLETVPERDNCARLPEVPVQTKEFTHAITDSFPRPCGREPGAGRDHALFCRGAMALAARLRLRARLLLRLPGLHVPQLLLRVQQS